MASPPRPRSPPSPSSSLPAKRQRSVHITDFTCVLCDVRCNDHLSLARHVSSVQHRRRLLSGGGAAAAAAAPPPAPAVRFDPTTAPTQLVSVVQTMYAFPSFATQTVHVMFHFRTQRLANTVISEAVRTSTTLGQYSALMLSAPMQLEVLAQTARDRLACADQPPVTLTEEEREQLQLDCLYRRFLRSEIGHHFALCYTVAYVCTIRDLASLLLIHRRQQPLLSSIAHAAMATMVMPSSKYHWMYHYHPRPSPRGGRRRSLSDLRILSCDCLTDNSHIHAQLTDIVNSAHTRHLTRFPDDNDGDDQDEDHPEEAEAEAPDTDLLYDGGDE